MYKIENHQLQHSRAPELQHTTIAYTPTPNISPGKTIKPKAVVIHYTASSGLQNTVNYLCDTSAKASYHLLIDHNGDLHQIADFNRRAWHAGASEFFGLKDWNSFSIGIGLINRGTISADPRLAAAAAKQDTISLPHKHGLKPRDWERYPAEQLRTLTSVLYALCMHYPITMIVGHDDIAPRRKIDPGPAFYQLPIFLEIDWNKPPNIIQFCRMFRFSKQYDRANKPAPIRANAQA